LQLLCWLKFCVLCAVCRGLLLQGVFSRLPVQRSGSPTAALTGANPYLNSQTAGAAAAAIVAATGVDHKTAAVTAAELTAQPPTAAVRPVALPPATAAAPGPAASAGGAPILQLGGGGAPFKGR
jgi:hypothetical protein